MAEPVSMKRAAIINAAGKYAKIGLQVVVSAIMARILSPEDYGIVAVITVFSTFFTTLADMGFGAAVIQRKDLSGSEVDDIYSFTVYMSVALMALFALASHPIAAFYEDDVYISLGYLLSISLLFNALNMVPNGILNREKRFQTIAVRTVVVYIGAAAVSVAMALAGFRYYALAAEAILTAFFTFVWNIKTTRPHFHVRGFMPSVRKVLGYSGYQFAFNLVNYFSRNLDNLLTGKFMGAAELGYYNKAYSLMLYPVNNLAGVISPVIHPMLSDFQDKKDVIYEQYLKILRLLACVGIYVAPLCYLAAPEIIEILYGPNWGSSVRCFQLLSIAIVPQMINSSTGGIFQALGNTKLLFQNSCINTGITVVAILLGVFVGGDIVSLSAFVGAAYVLHFLTAAFMLVKLGFRYSLAGYGRALLPEIILFAVTYGAALVFPLSFPNIIVSTLIKVAYLTAVYLVVAAATGDLKFVLKILKR